MGISVATEATTGSSCIENALAVPTAIGSTTSTAEIALPAGVVAPAADVASYEAIWNSSWPDEAIGAYTLSVQLRLPSGCAVHSGELGDRSKSCQDAVLMLPPVAAARMAKPSIAPVT